MFTVAGLVTVFILTRNIEENAQVLGISIFYVLEVHDPVPCSGALAYYNTIVTF